MQLGRSVSTGCLAAATHTGVCVAGEQCTAAAAESQSGALHSSNHGSMLSGRVPRPLTHGVSPLQVCIYKGFCVKNGNFAIIMKLYSYSLANRVSHAPGMVIQHSHTHAWGIIRMPRLEPHCRRLSHSPAHHACARHGLQASATD
jgi:hypothetical protein